MVKYNGVKAIYIKKGKKMKKLILLISMLALFATMLASCKDKGNDENNNDNGSETDNNTPCATHTDDNGDSICDVCEEIIFLEDTEVEVVFTVKDTDGNALSGFKAIFTDSEGNVVTSEESGADGRITVSLYHGRHSVTYDYNSEVYGYYLSSTTSIQINGDTSALDLYLIDNNPDGSEEKPFAISYENESITLGANTSYHYIIYRVVNLSFELTGENVKVKYGEAEYTPDENGKIRFNLVGVDTNSVARLVIENTANEEKTYGVNVESIPGSQANPFIIENAGTAVSTGNITSDNIVYYSFTADADGIFSITVTSDTGSVSMTNTSNSQNVTMNSDSVKTVSLSVKAGDKIIIDVSTNSKTEVVVTFLPELSDAE